MSEKYYFQRLVPFGGLTDDDRTKCQMVLSSDSRQMRKRARILLSLDASMPMHLIEEDLDVDRRAITTLIKRYTQEGLAAALFDRPRTGRPKRMAVPMSTVVSDRMAG